MLSFELRMIDRLKLCIMDVALLGMDAQIRMMESAYSILITFIC